MDSFTKGFTYLVRCNRYWYIVQQHSQRGWVATVFTHVCPPHDIAEFSGNGKQLFEKLRKIDDGGLLSIAYRSTTKMRKDMFSILQYGEIK